MATGEAGFAHIYQVSQRIQADSTTTTVTDDENPTQVGEWVAFTATVTPNAATDRVPNGTIQFTLDGSEVGEPLKLTFKGRVTWETSRLHVGEHVVTAIYKPGSDSLFLPSTSAGKIHTVQRCPCGHGEREN